MKVLLLEKFSELDKRKKILKIYLITRIRELSVMNFSLPNSVVLNVIHSFARKPMDLWTLSETTILCSDNYSEAIIVDTSSD